MSSKRSPADNTAKDAVSSKTNTTTVKASSVKAPEKKTPEKKTTEKGGTDAASRSRWQRLDADVDTMPSVAAAFAPAKQTVKHKPRAAAPPPTLDDDSGDLVVFAFRMTRAEREEIHDAAGPAKASRFVRRVVLAAARGDVGTLRAIMLEAQKGAAVG
jgi:hypothetical protein